MNSNKIFFYSGNQRQFRTTMIGYLYELCQSGEAEVYLHKERMDLETEKALARKDLFPNLVERMENPDLVIVPSDMHSFYEMRLLRWAKKVGAKTMAIQCSLYDKAKTVSDYIDWENAKKMPMPVVKARKYLGHYWKYYIEPLFRFERPFFGKSSYILHKGQSGMRDADIQVVWDEWQKDILLKDGVLEEKLKVEPHPIETHYNIFREAYFKNEIQNLVVMGHIFHNEKKTILLLLPTDIEVDEKHEDLYQKIIFDFSRQDLNVLISSHPNTKIGRWSGYKKNNIDKSIYRSDLVIGLPPAFGTSLYIADLMGKETIIYDPFKEWRGDFLKGRGNIKYIDNHEDFNLCYSKAI